MKKTYFLVLLLVIGSGSAFQIVSDKPMETSNIQIEDHPNILVNVVVDFEHGTSEITSVKNLNENYNVVVANPKPKPKPVPVDNCPKEEFAICFEVANP